MVFSFFNGFCWIRVSIQTYFLYRSWSMEMIRIRRILIRTCLLSCADILLYRCMADGGTYRYSLTLLCVRRLLVFLWEERRGGSNSSFLWGAGCCGWGQGEPGWGGYHWWRWWWWFYAWQSWKSKQWAACSVIQVPILLYLFIMTVRGLRCQNDVRAAVPSLWNWLFCMPKFKRKRIGRGL